MPPPLEAGGERLLQVSPGRTVTHCAHPAHADGVVVKLFTAGAPLEAEHEFAMGRLCAGSGVVAHLAVGTDPVSLRPALTTAFVAGESLARKVARRGALPAAEACALLAPVAATLARLHALATGPAPRGVRHGDVKPANLIATADPTGAPLPAATTVLVDFEHALPIGQPAPRGGTAPFAAPELGLVEAMAAPAQDVFSLGATLRWLVTGGSMDGALPSVVAAFVEHTTHAEPEHRPTAGSCAATLAELARTLGDDPEEQLRIDADRATFAHPAAPHLSLPAAGLWRRRRRLHARLERHTSSPLPDPPDDPLELDAQLRRCERWLARFPAHPQLLGHRQRLLDATTTCLAGAAATVQELVRDGDTAAARRRLANLNTLLERAERQPGGLPLPPGASGQNPLLGAPRTFLQRLAGQLELDAAELAERSSRAQAAIRRLDLASAEAEAEALAGLHGGTAGVVADLRDRLHRLAFHLDRAARSQPNVIRLEGLWPGGDLEPLRSVVLAAARASRQAPGDDATNSRGGAIGLRSLQRTLTQLVAEIPELADAHDALQVLTAALADLSDQAWTLLAEAQRQLQAVPVPVRPLQLTLGRLDTLRLLEALVDRPGRGRGELQDAIEALRLALEQARATRDRLAASAEHALARGHWTTGLFEMERAVAGLQPSDDREAAQAARLQEKLAAARQKKRDVEAAARRNVELATAHATLQDDPRSTHEQRLRTLVDRRDTLTFLVMHAPSERADLYRRDLRDVETRIALEQAEHAEQQLYATADTLARLQLATAALDRLVSMQHSGCDDTVVPSGRMQRLVEHWQTLVADCRAAVAARQAAASLRTRQRRRLVAFAAMAALATAAAIVFAVRPWFQGTPSYAGEKR